MARFTTDRLTGITSRSWRQRHAEAARTPMNARPWRITRHLSLNFPMGTWITRLSDARAGVSYTPEQAVLLMNVAYIQLQRSEFGSPLEYLDHARRLAPGNADVYKLSAGPITG